MENRKCVHDRRKFASDKRKSTQAPYVILLLRTFNAIALGRPIRPLRRNPAMIDDDTPARLPLWAWRTCEGSRRVASTDALAITRAILDSADVPKFYVCYRTYMHPAIGV